MNSFHFQAIAFDVGDTLCYPRSGSWLLPPNLFDFIDSQAWASVSAERLAKAKRAARVHLAQTHIIDGEQEELEKFYQFYQTLFSFLPECNVSEEILTGLTNDRVFCTGRAIYYDDVHPCLQALQSQYRLGVLSDTWPSLRRAMHASKVDHYFEQFILSCDVGTQKPDMRMYEAAIQAFNLPAHQILFIDNLIENLDAAAQFGMSCIQICRNKQPVGKYPAIEDLFELCAMLDQKVRLK